MQNPLIIGIYGYSNTGKTTLITTLINKCNADGLHVATIKQSTKPYSIDAQHSDTWRHTQAGAQTVVFTSPYTTVLHTTESLNEIQAIDLLSSLAHIDVILIEGSHHPRVLKIRIGSIKERENTGLTLNEENIEKAYAFIKKHMTSDYKSKQVTLQVNGKDIALSDFPEEIILKTILGMLSSLHGVDVIESFTLSYR